MLNQKQLDRTLFIYAAILFLSFTLPIHASPFRTYFHELLGVMSVIFVLGYMGCLPQINLRIPKLVVVPVFLIVIIGIQISYGLILYPIDMIFPILILVCFVCAIIFGATIAMQENGIEKLSLVLATTFVLAGLVCVILQHLQVLNLPLRPFVFPLSFKQQLRPYANLGQPNLLALLLCFSLASVWFLYLKQRVKPLAGLVIAVTLLWGIALTQSRIAWMILPLYLILSWRHPSQTQRISKIVAPLLLLLFAGFVFFMPHFFSLLGIVVDTMWERAGQTSVRIVLWQEALRMSLMHPWIGAGWYQFGPQQILLSTYFSPTEYSDNAHNILLNLLAEIGWPITILLIIGMAYWFYAACIRRWNNVEVRFLSLILLAIAIHSLVEFPLWFCFVLVPFGVLLGALHVERLGWENYVIARGWLVGFFTAAALIATGLTWDYLRVVNGFVALKSQVEGKIPDVGSTDKPDFTVFPQYYDFFRLFKISVGPGISDADLHFLEHVSLRFGHPLILARLALTYANNNRPNEALQVLITMQRLFAGNYADVYAAWKEYAQLSPSLYAEIFNRLPTPEITKQFKDSDVVGAEQ
jgi:hypothetical protein